MTTKISMYMADLTYADGRFSGTATTSITENGRTVTERRQIGTPAPPALSPRLFDALGEVSRYRADTPFWWRRANMAKLAELGLVENWTPTWLANSKSKTRPYRITTEGRAALARSQTGEG